MQQRQAKTPSAKEARAAKAEARKRQAVVSTGMAAGLVTLVSFYVPSFMSMFVEQRELLLVFTALLAALMVGLHEMAKQIALLRDNFIDRFEAFHLDLFQVFKMLGILACVSYAGQIFIEYFMSGPIAVPIFLYCIVVLLGLALALFPLFKLLIFHWTDDDDEEEEGVEN